MNKFKCEKCSHEATEAGYCPKDGAALKEVAVSADAKLDALIGKIGDIVTGKVADAMKEYGFDKATPGAKFVQSAKLPVSNAEKLEHVKGLLSDTDRKSFEEISGDKEQVKFLKQARIAYFFKNFVMFQITKDPDYLQHVKALAEGVDADGGYLTPREFRAQLVEDLQDQPYLRNLVTVIPMNTDFLELPTLASSVKTSWGSENTSINTTTARFGTLTFAPKRLNSIMYTSRELVADSALNVVQLITRLFIEAIGREEDRVIINGSGSGQPKGILQETLSGIDNGNDDSTLPDNIVKLPYRLGKAYRRNARWIVNSLSLGSVRSRRTTAGDFIFRDGANAGEPGILAGYPVAEQNDMPLDSLLFGDLSYYYLGDRERVSVETTTEGAGTFEKHQVAIKVVERIDGKVAITNAFRLLTNAGID